ncbi:peptidoglycan recognition protein family protein [Streptomyces lycii]|uniref:Peptidoglycan recognition protein n=1 Tax=Streptomyces lycii TaxID=2654337 RepID=A0ABQ7FMV1_9ACTN|nr:peptidoglycan recognition protein [Streptomyces lycii]KAF4410160.1 peptidoglycan recognition protein [Streptomyces lycii]
MRALLASSIGVACTAALALPLAVPAGAAAGSAPRSTAAAPAAAAPGGSTQSLPLRPLAGSDRGATTRGLAQREVRPFSMAGVVWDEAGSELHGRAQIRTRDARSGQWSGWRDLETHNDAPDAGSGERSRGGTAPVWVGDSDAVQARVLPERPADRAPAALPEGLRLELVDPGPAPAAGGHRAADGDLTAAEAAASAVNAEFAEIGATEIKAQQEAPAGPEDERAGAADGVGPRPGIMIRRGWGANESWRESQFRYTNTVRAAFVHHSATGNNYSCKQAPSVIRGIYRYHTQSLKWRDIGYNFLVDKCGQIYEGRAGGVARAVMGAHTLGFNENSMGIAVLGTFGSATPPKDALDGVAKLTAWKLGLFRVNAKGKVTMVSGGSNKYGKGTRVTLNAISGHRDGFATECPGAKLYGSLWKVRSTAGRLQGR